MTKNILLILTFLPSFLSAQANFVGNIIPKIGDEYTMILDKSIDKIDLKESKSGSLTWDFSSLSNSGSKFNYKVVSLPNSSNPSAFKDATLVVKQGKGETFYKINDTNDGDIDTELVELGISGSTGFNFDLDTQIKYDGSNLIAFSKMANGEKLKRAYSFSLTEPVTSLPDSIRTELEKLKVDKIVIDSDITKNYHVNGYGQIKLPNNEYDVVRLETITNTSTELKLHTTSGFWISLPEDFFKGELSEVFGNRTIKEYTFYADGYHFPIVKAYKFNSDYNEDRILFYNQPQEAVAVENYPNQKPGMRAYPNPTFGDITFEQKTLAGDRIEIYTLLGRRLKTLHFNGKKTISANLGFLSKGMYIYSLITKNGEKLSSKKLMILNP